MTDARYEEQRGRFLYRITVDECVDLDRDAYRKTLEHMIGIYFRVRVQWTPEDWESAFPIAMELSTLVADFFGRPVICCLHEHPSEEAAIEAMTLPRRSVRGFVGRVGGDS